MANRSHNTFDAQMAHQRYYETHHLLNKSSLHLCPRKPAQTNTGAFQAGRFSTKQYLAFTQRDSNEPLIADRLGSPSPSLSGPHMHD